MYLTALTVSSELGRNVARLEAIGKVSACRILYFALWHGPPTTESCSQAWFRRAPLLAVAHSTAVEALSIEVSRVLKIGSGSSL